MVMEKDYNLMVGLRIRELRESLRLSREKFSEKCDISPSFLADIERGKIIYPQIILSWGIKKALTGILELKS